MGFVIATGLLHGLGIGMGSVHRWDVGRVALRIAGAVVLGAGIFFFWNALT
jgi:urease accessory protein